jgi:hypothetical protein
VAPSGGGGGGIGSSSSRRGGGSNSTFFAAEKTSQTSAAAAFAAVAAATEAANSHIAIFANTILQDSSHDGREVARGTLYTCSSTLQCFSIGATNVSLSWGSAASSFLLKEKNPFKKE